MSSPAIPIHPNVVVCRRDIQIVEALEIDGVQVTVKANRRGHKIAMAAAAGSRIIKYAPEVDEVAREIFSLVESIASGVETKSDHREFALPIRQSEPIRLDGLHVRREWQIRRIG